MTFGKIRAFVFVGFLDFTWGIEGDVGVISHFSDSLDERSRALRASGADIRVGNRV